MSLPTSAYKPPRKIAALSIQDGPATDPADPAPSKKGSLKEVLSAISRLQERVEWLCTAVEELTAAAAEEDTEDFEDGQGSDEY